ncbi:MAG: ATP-grasp domain-containing protein [Prevotellaceae bacterium]|nr:ATP-grasp domain-containing protein [Candidatus Faecinaster equi]
MNILITTVGRRTYLVEYFKEALRGIGKLYVSNSIYTYTVSKADGFCQTPSFFDETYIPTIISFCKEKNISAIISLLDLDAQTLAEHKKEFDKAGIQLIVSGAEAMDICNDKWKTYLFLNKIGIKQPLSFISKDATKQAMKEGQLTYPIIIKPRWGIGSFGIYKIENEQELDVLYAKLHKDIFSTYMGRESKKDIEACIILQQYIEGKEYGVEVLNDLKSNYVATFAKQKLAMRAGETDIAVTVDVKPFESLAKTISDGLKHIALLDMDCIMTLDGQIYILELNCRFGGQYPFTHNAGVNVPLQMVKWLQDEETNAQLVTQQNGVKSCKELVPVKI